MPKARKLKTIIQLAPGGVKKDQQKSQAGQSGAHGKPSMQHAGGKPNAGAPMHKKKPSRGSSDTRFKPKAFKVMHAAGQKRPFGKNPGRMQHAASGDGRMQCTSIVDRQAATALQTLVEADATQRRGASLKSLTLAPHITAKKATYAVTCQALKFYQVLKDLVEGAGIQEVPDQMSPFTAIVLVYELLLGEGLTRKGRAERAVLKAEARLREALQQEMTRQGVQSPKDLIPAAAQFSGKPHPRTARVNTLKLTVDRALQLLAAPPEDWAPHHRAASQQLSQAVSVDPLLPELLLFPPGTDLHDHPLVADASLILQSKASCMPAAALAPEPGWTVVDCCAAPGNKTTHVAARMQGRGRVFAFDKDPQRLRRLQDNAQRTGAGRVIAARCADFLTIDPEAPEYAQVRGVILDPSCSGSGTIFTRMDHLLPSHHSQPQQQQPQRPAVAEEEEVEPAGQQQQQQQQQAERARKRQRVQQQGEAGAAAEQTGGSEQQAGGHAAPGAAAADSAAGDADGDASGSERVQQLAKFQLSALLHALRFPALCRLVYSTCSIHVEENEGVVGAAMEEARARGFELADPFPSWHRRGLPLFDGCDKLVRTDAYEDGTDGFFVAVFERKQQQQQPDGKKRKRQQGQQEQQQEEGGQQEPAAAPGGGSAQQQEEQAAPAAAAAAAGPKQTKKRAAAAQQQQPGKAAGGKQARASAGAGAGGKQKR